MESEISKRFDAGPLHWGLRWICLIYARYTCLRDIYGPRGARTAARAGVPSGLDDMFVAGNDTAAWPLPGDRPVGDRPVGDRQTGDRPLAGEGAGNRARRSHGVASDVRNPNQGPASTIETLRFDTMLDAGWRPTQRMVSIFSGTAVLAGLGSLGRDHVEAANGDRPPSAWKARFGGCYGSGQPPIPGLRYG